MDYGRLFEEWNWVLQAFVVVFAALMLDYAQRRVMGRVQRALEVRTKTVWDEALIAAVRRPLSLLIWVLGIAFAADIARKATDAEIFVAVGPIRELGVIAAFTWFLLRLVRNAEAAYKAGVERKEVKADITTIDALSKLLRMSVLITATLVALQTMGYSIAGVLAFGGIGGIAVGFAARDLLANFFGGLMIMLDRPFSVGDWIRSPDREIEGTVEDISWRLTRIRTFDARPLYVPNATFSTITVENPSRMHNRRIYETVGIRYDDADEMAGIVADVKAMLQSHPDIEPGRLLMVNFNSFAPSSLDFFIYAFTKTVDWARFHEVKQDVLLKIVEIIGNHGAEIAFPTSTVHVPGGLALKEEAEPAIKFPVKMVEDAGE